MDATTLRMLRDPPDDLRAIGWEFILKDSRPYPMKSPRWYIAVYVRPYAPGVKDDRFVGAVHHGHVRISTNETRSASWEAAC